MPKVIEDIPPQGGKYPWDRWLDGQLRAFSAGEDFHCTPISFAQAAYSAGRSRGIRVSTVRRGDVVYVRGFPKDAQ